MYLVNAKGASGKCDAPGLYPIGLGGLCLKQGFHPNLRFVFVEDVGIFFDGTVVEQARAGDTRWRKVAKGLGNASDADAVVETGPAIAKGGGIESKEHRAEALDTDGNPKMIDFVGRRSPLHFHAKWAANDAHGLKIPGRGPWVALDSASGTSDLAESVVTTKSRSVPGVHLSFLRSNAEDCELLSSSKNVLGSVMAQIGERRIIHLDMDAFYASIEMRDHPELAGRPVGVGGTSRQRGVLTTCNYEARKYGVRSAMPTFMALQKCPHMVLMPVRFEVYRRDSEAIRAILRRHTPLVEPLSLDEAYLDVSTHPGDAAALAYVIRRQILQKTRLPASAGIAPNKFLAKVASDWRKPNGQFELKTDAIANFMHQLPVERIPGVGRVATEKMHQLGVKTCADLQAFSRVELAGHFGKFGLELFQLCRGMDDRPVEPARERKSLSTERTFSLPLTTLDQCLERLALLFPALLEDLGAREELPPIQGIFLKMKYADFSRTSIDRVGWTPEYAHYCQLLEEGWARTGRPIRLLGIGVRFFSVGEPLADQLDLPWGE